MPSWPRRVAISPKSWSAKQILGPDQLEEAKGVAQQTGSKLQDALVKLGYASPGTDHVGAMAEFHGMQFVDLTDVTIPACRHRNGARIGGPRKRRHAAVPGKRHPQDHHERSDRFRHHAKAAVHPQQGDPAGPRPREQIVEAINRHYGQTETESVDSMLPSSPTPPIDFTETEAAKQRPQPATRTATPRSSSCQPDHLRKRSRLRASDIHIEPFADRVRIRYRIDGVLVERDSPPRRLLAPMVSRLKIMGSIDISEKRRPQDGRIKMTVKGKHFDLRVSILPTVHGQSVRHAHPGSQATSR